MEADAHTVIKRSSGEILTCSECSNETPAYKCPSCSSKYCSVSCCNGHQLHCSGMGKTEEAQQSSDKRRYNYDFPSEDTVPLERLLDMKNDERVKELSKSATLRSLIKKLDEAPNPKLVFSEV